MNSDAPLLLVVEDNPDHARLAEYVLTRAGYRIEHVRTAERALEIIDELAPACVLMDISLRGGMSGADATRILRSREETRNLPVIALTAHAMMGDRDLFIDSGCTDYVAKPFEADQLIAVVRRIVPLPRTAA